MILPSSVSAGVGLYCQPFWIPFCGLLLLRQTNAGSQAATLTRGSTSAKWMHFRLPTVWPLLSIFPTLPFTQCICIDSAVTAGRRLWQLAGTRIIPLLTAAPSPAPSPETNRTFLDRPIQSDPMLGANFIIHVTDPSQAGRQAASQVSFKNQLTLIVAQAQSPL